MLDLFLFLCRIVTEAEDGLGELRLVPTFVKTRSDTGK